MLWFWQLLIFNFLFLSESWAQYSIIQVGHVGSLNAKSIAISGSYAYVATGGGIRVFDVSNPTSPVQIGTTTNIQDFAFSIAARGNYVFATGYPKLQVYDVTTPSSPFRIGSVSGGSPIGLKVIDVAGDTAYVGDGQILNTFDVSTLNSPSLFQATNTQQYIWTLNVASNVASVTSNLGFGSWDVSTPSSCSLVFFTNVLSLGENYVAGYVRHNGIAYVSEWPSAISIFDISNPAAVTFLKRTNVAPSMDGVAIAGANLLISANRFLLYEISNTTNLVEIGRSAIRSNRGRSIYAPRLLVQSNFIYSAEDASGLKIFSIFPKLGISTPSANTALLKWPLPLAGEVNLQECTNLYSPTWTPVTNNPTVIGNQMKVELPMDGGSRYYRLQFK